LPVGEAGNSSVVIFRAARRLIAAAAVVGLLLVPATANAVHFPNQGGCTNPGTERGFCSAVRVGGAVPPYFELRSFESGGLYDLCFRSHGVTEACILRRLRHEAEGMFWVARIEVDRSPIKKPGTIRVRWIDARTGHRVGPQLHYTLTGAGDPSGKVTD
jgi:hypothetical protein